MKSASIAPANTTGNSAKPVTSSSSPGSGLTGGAQLDRAAVEIGADQFAALVLVEDDVSVLQLFEVFGGVVGAKLARRQKTVAAGGAADRDAIDRQRHDRRRRKGR